MPSTYKDTLDELSNKSLLSIQSKLTKEQTKKIEDKLAIEKIQNPNKKMNEETRFRELAVEYFNTRDTKYMGGMLEDDKKRYGMKEGGPGIEALREEAPEVVERMGYQEGGSLLQDEDMPTHTMPDGTVMPGATHGEDEMMMPEEDMMPEEEMLPDDEMEDEYLDFILDEALDSKEEDYLMSQLQDNDRLSEIFDKVIDVAQEFAGSGPVEGPGSGVSDSIPARLSDGEFVFTAKSVEEIGADNLMAMMKDAEMKADERQGLAEGGQPEEEETVVMPVEQPASQQDIRVTKTTVGTQASMQEEQDLIGDEVKKSMLRGSRNLG